MTVSTDLVPEQCTRGHRVEGWRTSDEYFSVYADDTANISHKLEQVVSSPSLFP